MSRVASLWEAASEVVSKHSSLLSEHRDAVLSRDPNYKRIEQLSELIATSLGTDSDPLALLESEYGIEEPRELNRPEGRTQPVPETDQRDNNPLSPEQATLETVARWRRVPIRGPAAIRFRKDVRQAYGHRCLFSGLRLPKLELVTSSPGVDAAHILPWASHGINSITNGICLNKLCHWAFDTGVLQLTFDPEHETYAVEIPDRVRAEALLQNFDLSYFETIEGVIDHSRLPLDRSNWPNPEHITRLNRLLFGK